MELRSLKHLTTIVLCYVAMMRAIQWCTSNQATQLNFTSKVGVYLKELQQILHVPIPTFHFHSHFFLEFHLLTWEYINEL